MEWRRLSASGSDSVVRSKPLVDGPDGASTESIASGVRKPLTGGCVRGGGGRLESPWALWPAAASGEAIGEAADVNRPIAVLGLSRIVSLQ